MAEPQNKSLQSKCRNQKCHLEPPLHEQGCLLDFSNIDCICLLINEYQKGEVSSKTAAFDFLQWHFMVQRFPLELVYNKL